MKQHLWTGSWPLMQGDRLQFGTVGASGPLAGEGTIVLHLRTKDVATYVEHEAINVVIPEAWARELAGKVSLVTTQIAHLRSLHQMDLLSSKALYEDDDVLPDGDRIVDGDDEVIVPVHEGAPRPSGPVSLSLHPNHAIVIYASDVGDTQISIEDVDAFRSSRAPAHPTTPGQSLAPFISIVERSRWKRQRDTVERVEEMDERPAVRHHFRIRFTTLLVEAIASRIGISPVPKEPLESPEPEPGRS
jgi:hypothetical protein